MNRGGRRSHATYPQEGPQLLAPTVGASIVNNGDIAELTNEELIRRTEDLAADLRTKTCELIDSLMEIDRRRLYRDLNFVSLFEYCVRGLRMSEGAAYRRIRAARAIKIYPPAGPLLREGKLTLESLTLLHPFLNDADAGRLIQETMGMSTRDVERLVAGRRTEPARRDIVRFISFTPPPAADNKIEATAPLFDSMDLTAPSASPALPPERADAPAVVTPGPSRSLTLVATPEPARPLSLIAAPGVRVSFTADEQFFKLLRHAQALMRHKYPDGRLDGIFRDALEALLRKKYPWTFPPAKRKIKSCALSTKGAPTVGANS